MTVPQFSAVVDGLVTTLRAAAGLGTPGDGSADVPVYDGPVPTNAPVMHFVAVGWDGLDGGDSESGAWDSEWAGTGAAAGRDETGRVSCCVIAGDGGDDFAALRRSVWSTMGLVEAALRSSPSIGAGPVVWQSELVAGAVQQGVSSRGAYIRVLFAVGYSART